MSLTSAFAPKLSASTVSLAVTGSSQTLNTDTEGRLIHFRLVNAGTQTIFLEFGSNMTSPTASTSTSLPMLANTVEVFTLPPKCIVAAIAATTGSTLYVTPGEGI